MSHMNSLQIRGTAIFTALLFIIAVPIEIALGLGIALVLHKPGLGPFKTLTRLSLVLPMATTELVFDLRPVEGR